MAITTFCATRSSRVGRSSLPLLPAVSYSSWASGVAPAVLRDGTGLLWALASIYYSNLVANLFIGESILRHF